MFPLNALLPIGKLGTDYTVSRTSPCPGSVLQYPTLQYMFEYLSRDGWAHVAVPEDEEYMQAIRYGLQVEHHPLQRKLTVNCWYELSIMYVSTVSKTGRPHRLHDV